MNATDLLTELRPPLDETSPDDAVLERILLAAPEPPRRRRYRRPLAIASATAAAATATVALVPTSDGPVGLQRAVAALAEPGVLLHFKVTTTHLPSGATESSETWQTPDGRRLRILRPNGHEFAYDQRGKRSEIYVPERDEVFVDTEPSLFADQPEPFGSIGSRIGDMPDAAGDLPALLTRALSGADPKVRHIGRTTVRGIDVDHIRIERASEIADARPGASLRELQDAPMKTVTTTRDIYVRHDNALPVRVVDNLEAFGNPENTKTVSEFSDTQKLALHGPTERLLKLAEHPGAERTVRGPFDDSKAGG
jgi:hypothetical protein